MKKYVVKLMIVAVLATVAGLVSYAVANTYCQCYNYDLCTINFGCSEWQTAEGIEWQECNPHDWWEVAYCETSTDPAEHCEEDYIQLCRGVDHFSCEYCCPTHYEYHTHRYVKEGDPADSECGV
jgi:hypothetical protein